MKYVIALVIVLLIGCGEKPAVDLMSYYDLSSQLRKQIKMLYAEDAYLIKYVTYNGKPSQVNKQKTDWNKEFDIFFEVDLHAPALIGLYTTDTVHNADSTVKLIYKAKGEDEMVRELTIHTNHQGDLLDFNSTVLTGSMLNKITRKISYSSYKSYRIDVTEDNRYTSDHAYTVKGDIYLPNDDYFE